MPVTLSRLFNKADLQDLLHQLQRRDEGSKVQQQRKNIVSETYTRLPERNLSGQWSFVGIRRRTSASMEPLRTVPSESKTMSCTVKKLRAILTFSAKQEPSRGCVGVLAMVMEVDITFWSVRAEIEAAIMAVYKQNIGY